MKKGDFPEAWAASLEALHLRKRRPDLQKGRPPHFRDVWNGGSLENRKVLVRCHHGLGDTIQFFRFLPKFQNRVEKLTLKAQRALFPLFEKAQGIEVLPDDSADPEFDVDLEIMEFPFVDRTTLANLPRQVPYVTPPLEEVVRMRRAMPKAGLKIGLCWKAGDFIPERSIPFSLLQDFLAASGRARHGIHFFSLQRGARVDFPFALGSEAPEEIVETAALIRNLDLVISVDTMVAHLAGALGCPVFTLLPYRADWRWMETREDSPWYPTMRLIRQPGPGDWNSVMENLQSRLAPVMQEFTE